MKNIKKTVCFILFALSIASCTIEDNSKIESFPFTVYADEWEWNPAYGRYEAVYNFPQLTGKIYEGGSIIGAAFVREGSVETQTSLPYSKTYSSTTGTYVETISFDVALGMMPTICFYIQTSDRLGTYLRTHNFKITLIGYK